MRGFKRSESFGMWMHTTGRLSSDCEMMEKASGSELQDGAVSSVTTTKTVSFVVSLILCYG